LRLQRLEALWRDLRAAIAAGRSTRRTLGQALITVDREAGVSITAAPPRRTGAVSHGRRNAAKHPFTKPR
jgi:hypothetical protein